MFLVSNFLDFRVYPFPRVQSLERLAGLSGFQLPSNPPPLPAKLGKLVVRVRILCAGDARGERLILHLKVLFKSDFASTSTYLSTGITVLPLH